MQIDFSVKAAGVSFDAALDAAPHATVAALREQLCAAVDGLQMSPALWCDGVPLAPDGRISDAPLRHGSIVTDADGSSAGEGDLTSLRVVGGPSAGRRTILRAGAVTIGRSPTCDVTLADVDASRIHAVIDVTDGAITITDSGSTNGTSIDGVPVRSTAPLHEGQWVRIGDSFLTIARHTEPPAVVHRAGASLLVGRPPRSRWSINRSEIEIPQAPATDRSRRIPVIAAVLPAVTGVALSWAMGSPQYLIFALLSPVTLLASSWGDRWQGRRGARRDRAIHAAQLAQANIEIAAAVSAEQRILRLRDPDPTAVEDVATLPSCRLWERQRDDDDVLTVRLGLADLPSVRTVRDGNSARQAGVASAVPCTVDLRAGPLGVAGPAEVIRAHARWLVSQLCTMRSPRDVNVALILDATTEAHWRWARWLPHVRSRAATESEQWSEFAADLMDTTGDFSAKPDASSSGPWLVVIIDCAAVRAAVPQLATLVSQRRGVTAIWLDETVAALPPNCVTTVEVSTDTGNRARSHDVSGGVCSVVLDQVDLPWAERVARALAPLVDAEGDPAAALPKECGLAELVRLDPRNATAIAGSWAAADGACAATLGVAPEGPLILDLARDGPHVLIAGTTGAGKSELLQTLVIGLAIAYPPEQVAFLLLDYKGGAAFAECADLPHTTGLVTDLDPNLTQRALVALDAEVRRRERILARAGVKDIAAYRRRDAPEALPRLVLIVDEFATLADELPQFIGGLVSIARRGRSLGLHLVLATQRPGTAISPDIRANTDVRICLRVTGPSESIDVIDIPDAARIEREVPGRAFMRIGQSVTPFQVAMVRSPSAAAKPEVRLERLAPWRQRPPGPVETGNNDLSAIASALRCAANQTKRPTAVQPWCDPLPDLIPGAGLRSHASGVSPIGKVDLPALQRQELLTIDLIGGSSVLVTGRARSGRSTALAMAAIRAAEQHREHSLHIQAIDTTGALAALARLPHCASYLPHEARARWSILVNRLVVELERRKLWLADHGYSSTDEAASAGEPLASIVLLVDGWQAFATASEERDAGRTTEALLTLARSCSAAGLTVLVAGGREALTPRISAAFTHRFLLAMSDSADFGVAGISPRDVPARMPPGRALRAADGAEVQFAFTGDAPTRTEQDRAVDRVRATSAGAPSDAIRVRPLPTRVAISAIAREADSLTLGVGGDDATPVGLPHGVVRLLVVGSPRSGRTTTLRTLLRQVEDARRVQVVASTRSPLAADAVGRGATVISPRGHQLNGAPGLPSGALVLIDDLQLCDDSTLGEALSAIVRDASSQVSVIAAGRPEEVASAYRGLGYELRRLRSALLLQPAPVDGDIVGVRLPRDREVYPPGRGLLVGLEPSGEPVPIHVALPE